MLPIYTIQSLFQVQDRTTHPIRTRVNLGCSRSSYQLDVMESLTAMIFLMKPDAEVSLKKDPGPCFLKIVM